jgi:hypothetical protein
MRFPHTRQDKLVRFEQVIELLRKQHATKKRNRDSTLSGTTDLLKFFVHEANWLRDQLGLPCGRYLADDEWQDVFMPSRRESPNYAKPA